MGSYVQTLYPLEYRTPPLPLVALIGCNEAHKDVADFFVHHLKPPLVSLFTTVEATDQFVARNFGPCKQSVVASAEAPSGIIKADWLSKHRGKKPAAALTLVSRQDLEGDPGAWGRMLELLRLVANAVAQCGAALVVGVVQGLDSGELPLERLTILSHNLSLEPRLIIPILARSIEAEPGRSAREASLRQLGALLHEQCTAVYSRQATRAAAKLAERQAAAAAAAVAASGAVLESSRRPGSTAAGAVPEYAIRAAFKLASFAEFRQDWVSAVQEYQAAYSLLNQAVVALPCRPMLPPQRWYELARCAELVNLKLLMLLMHQGGMDDAAAQAQRHLRLFADPQDRLPAAGRACHLTFLARQHQVIAEVVCMRAEAAAAAGQPSGGHATKELSRPLLLLAAAELSVERRKVCEGMKVDTPPVSSSSLRPIVRRGAYLGQLAARAATGVALRRLSDAEYLHHLREEELGGTGRAGTSATPSAGLQLKPSAPLPSSSPLLLTEAPVAASINAINSALAALTLRGVGAAAGGRVTSSAGAGPGSAGPMAQERLRSRLSLMLAKEHAGAGNLSAARKLLLTACATYRSEGWSAPQAHCLHLLLEVAGKLRLFPEQAVYTLELAALSAGAGRRSSRGAEPSEEAAACSGYLAALSEGAQGLHSSAPLSPSPSPSPSPPSTASSPSLPGAVPVVGNGGLPQSHAPREYRFFVQHPGRAFPPDQQQQQSQAADDGGHGGPDVTLRHRQDFGWWRCLSIAVGSPRPLTGTDTIDLHLAIWNLLPVPLRLEGGVMLTLEDAFGQWDVPLTPGPLLISAGPTSDRDLDPTAASDQRTDDASPGRDSVSGSGRGSLLTGSGGGNYSHTSAASKGRSSNNGSVAGNGNVGGRTCSPVVLLPGRWERSAVRISPRTVGRLHVVRVLLTLSNHASVCFIASSFATQSACSASLGGLHSLLGLPEPFCGSSSGGYDGSVREAAWQLLLPHLGPLPSIKATTCAERTSAVPQQQKPGSRSTAGAAAAAAAAAASAPAMALVSEHVPVFFTVDNPGFRLEGAVMEFAVRLGPGLSPLDMTLTVDDQGRLANLPLDGQGRISMNSVPAGGSHCVRVWLRAARPGKVSLTGLLLCPSALTATMDLSFEEPFEYRSQLSSEAGVHTLTPPRLAGPQLSSGVTPVTIGQQLMLRTSLRGLQHAELQLIDAKLHANRDAGITPVADLACQLLGWPIPLMCGDVISLLLPLCPTRMCEVPVSLGSLQLMWRRRPSAAAAGAAGDSAAKGPSPDMTVTTLMDLPVVTVGDSLLTVRTVGPAQVTAGIAFTYSLQIQNFGHHAVELAVALLDTPGFVLSGERSQVLTVGPRDSGSCMWLLVAHAAGHLPLPSARVAAPRINCTLTTQAAHVHVAPF